MLSIIQKRKLPRADWIIVGGTGVGNSQSAGQMGRPVMVFLVPALNPQSYTGLELKWLTLLIS